MVEYFVINTKGNITNEIRAQNYSNCFISISLLYLERVGFSPLARGLPCRGEGSWMGKVCHSGPFDGRLLLLLLLRVIAIATV